MKQQNYRTPPQPKLVAEGSLAAETSKLALATIVIPTFKRPAPLAKCLEELDKQLSPDRPFGVILLDNHSEDETLDIAKEFAKRIPWLKVYSRGRNVGAIANTLEINMLVETEYTWWLTDDDTMLPGSLDYVYEALQTSPQAMDWIISPLQTYDAVSGSHICTVAPSGHFTEVITKTRSAAHARHAWAYSRQIWNTAFLQARINEIKQSDHLSKSGYWMIYPALKAIQASGGYFLGRSLVSHVYGNQTHWECIHPNERKRRAKLDVDYIYTFALSSCLGTKQIPLSGEVVSSVMAFLEESFYLSSYKDVAAQIKNIALGSIGIRLTEPAYAAGTLAIYLLIRAYRKLLRRVEWYGLTI